MVGTHAFCTLEFGELARTVDFETGTEDFDLISIHCCLSFSETILVGRGYRTVQVLAIRILQFSRRFGELTAIVLSRIKPSLESVTI